MDLTKLGVAMLHFQVDGVAPRQRGWRGVFDARPKRIDAGVEVCGFVKVLPTDGV